MTEQPPCHNVEPTLTSLGEKILFLNTAWNQLNPDFLFFFSQQRHIYPHICSLSFVVRL